MKKLLLLCLMALMSLASWASRDTFYSVDFEVDGIYYHILEDGSVAVTAPNYQKETSTYVGDMVLESSVTNLNDGVTYTVTTIGECAFYSCSLTSINLPETITCIDVQAFYTSSLTEINIPKQVTTIGSSAFFGCSSLKSITFPDNLDLIADNMCTQCSALEEVTLGKSITSIGYAAFQSCSKLTEITIPEKVTNIGQMAFCFCSGLAKVYSLNPEPPTCGSMAFTSASTCTLYVPQGCLDVYSSADTWSTFSSIVEMDETITPPTVETIAVTDITNSTATLHGTVSAGSEEILEIGFQYWADANATQTIVATSVSGDEISSTIQRLSSATEYTFRAYATTATETTYGDRITFTTTNYDFAVENSDGQTIYYKILSSSGANRICEVQYLYYMSADNVVAYKGELTIPEIVSHESTTYHVVQINEYAFYECRNLTKVTIPESVTDIGPNSFQNCTSLEEATFPNTVATIWEYTFDGCASLKEAIIPNSVTSVQSYVFRGCTSLEEVTFPGNVNITTTYRGYFEGCTGLKKVTLEDGLTSTCPYMFQDCTSLEEVSFPTSMTEIAAYTFTSCTSLKEISLPNTIAEIGGYAFRDCTSLTSFTYPSSMTNTGVCALYRCTSLEDVTLSPNTLEISNGTFAYCTNLKEMTIPEGVTTTGYQVFLNCTNIETIRLPKTLELIGYQTFKGCSNMEKLYCLNPTPPTLNDQYPYEWFDGINEDCMLYVSVGSREEYSTTDVWKDFFNTITEVAIVETLEADGITTTSAILNGSVVEGDTPITQQGFEFWKNGSENVLTTIYVEDDDLTFSITNLDPETKYTYRAFAVTADGTFYGDDVELTTAEDIPDGIDNVGMSSTNSENIEGIYSTFGQKLNTTVRGVNIVRYSDGTTKKVIIK